LIRVGNLAGQYFRASAFLVTKLVDMAGLYDFSKVSASVHCLAVDPVQIAVAGLVELELGG
jgi:hypothetical protein